MWRIQAEIPSVDQILEQLDAWSKSQKEVDRKWISTTPKYQEDRWAIDKRYQEWKKIISWESREARKQVFVWKGIEKLNGQVQVNNRRIQKANNTLWGRPDWGWWWRIQTWEQQQQNNNRIQQPNNFIQQANNRIQQPNNSNVIIDPNAGVWNVNVSGDWRLNVWANSQVNGNIRVNGWEVNIWWINYN